jgi:hypothetical protein
VVPAVLLALAASAPLAPVAHAGGVNFNWGTACYTEAPVNFRTFACATNAGSHPMTMSFKLDSAMPDVVGIEIAVEGVADDGAVPDWWKLESAGCRPNALSYSGDNSGVATETCADWNGGAGYGVPATYAWDTDRAHVTTAYAIDASRPFDMQAGVEYYAGTLSIRNANTVGPGACAGCGAGFTWWISKITVAGLSGRRDELTLGMPGGNQFLYWNRAPRIPSAMALVSAPQPSAYHQPVTLTATVTPPAVTGVVEFSERDSTLGSSTVTGGTATLTVNGLSEGDHPVTARYGGDGDVERAFSPPWTHTVTPRAASTVGLTSSPNPSVMGHPVVLSAWVSPSGASGTVTFRDLNNGWSLGTVPVHGDTAVYTLAAGFATATLHPLNATYNGDDTHAPATSPVLTQTVTDRTPTSVTFTVSPSPCPALEWLTFVARIDPPTATGSVGVRDGSGETYGGGDLKNGVATWRIGLPCGGTYHLYAHYDGDGGHAPSISPTIPLDIVPNASRATLSASPGTSCPGQEVTLSARVTNLNNQGGCGLVASFVQFLVDGASVGSVLLDVETATLKVTTLPPGPHKVQAVYSGSPSLQPCSSSFIWITVRSPGPTAATVTTSPNPSCLDQEVTLHACLSSPSGCVPIGAVQFEVDGAAFGAPVTLSSGCASLGGLTGLTSGPHPIRALFSGALYPACSSSVATHVVTSTAPRILEVSDIPDDQGGQVDVAWAGLCAQDSVEAYWILRAVPGGLATGAAVTSDPARPSPPRLGERVRLDLDGAAGEWEYVGTQTALHDSTYRYVVPTTGDSVAGSIGRALFMIEARTTVGEPRYSVPDSGYSVDNLAPAAPVSFRVTTAGGKNVLSWDAAREPDFVAYRLYRGGEVGFDLDPAALLSVQATTGYTDPTGDFYIYKLCAVDAHGNIGPDDIAQPDHATGVADGTLSFALEGVRPNPARGGHLAVTFTLPRPAPARLELVDVGGRRIVSLAVGSLGAGRHTLELATGLRPGVYLVRLTQGAAVRVVRVGVLD